jgi:dethiobiotin synthetase
MLVPDDAIRLQAAAACSEPIERICPYRFAEPLAPSIAAERAGQTIDIDRLFALYASISEAHDITIVEGAGGLMVPLLPSYTYADFIAVLKLPTVAVAANRLGAINHLVLTLEHAACKGVRVLGYVLNRVSDEPSLAGETNREVLLGMTAVACLGELPYLEGARSIAVFPPALFEAELDLRPIETVLS